MCHLSATLGGCQCGCTKRSLGCRSIFNIVKCQIRSERVINVLTCCSHYTVMLQVDWSKDDELDLVYG
ncbi:uncharacterized protein BDW47DRAFT_18054 [Aspergillus candidus]|uniref:Uncharacterized protein n=1 Tax=Aspergillus candidus TaxID=41067 RepID=A0A2I2FEA1_ASPCN|nr:hypothetical protein BDW47DRAFT_18054 [Aspergillus candidus]PLB38937.1 hypothetical protein BDW47DRAFT_18054 [Aspergillus candidus]